MALFTKDFKEILSGQMISVTGGLIAGLLLTFAIDKLYFVPGFLILFPGFLEMRGNISGSLSARLGSGLWLGVVKPKVHRNRVARGNAIAAFILAIIVSLVLGIIAFFAGWIFFGVMNYRIIVVSLIAVIISSIIEIPATIFFTFWLFRHHYDPNDIMGPYVTTSGDIISIISLLIAFMVV